MHAVGGPTATCDQKDTAWAVKFLIEHRLVASQISRKSHGRDILPDYLICLPL